MSNVLEHCQVPIGEVDSNHVTYSGVSSWCKDIVKLTPNPQYPENYLLSCQLARKDVSAGCPLSSRHMMTSRPVENIFGHLVFLENMYFHFPISGLFSLTITSSGTIFNVQINRFIREIHFEGCANMIRC